MIWYIILGYLLIGAGLGVATYISYKDKRYWDWEEFLFSLVCWGPALIILIFYGLMMLVRKLKRKEK